MQAWVSVPVEIGNGLIVGPAIAHIAIQKQLTWLS